MTSTTLPRQAAEHWQGAAQGELRLPRCRTCSNVWFPPSRHCPRCLSDGIEWQAVSKRGTVAAWCRFHRAYFTPSLGLTPPYTVILVRLDAGPLLYSNPGNPASVPPVGTRVVATFVGVAPGQAVVRFDPAGDEP